MSSKKSKSSSTSTSSIDSYTQGLQRQNFQDAMSRFSGATYTPVSAEQIQSYMSPYTSQVIDSSLATIGNQEAQALNQVRDQAIRAGAFGGSGRNVAEALTRGEYDRNRQATIANLNNQGYQTALETASAQNAAANQYPLLIQQILNGTLGTITPTVTQTGSGKSSGSGVSFGWSPSSGFSIGG